MKEMTSVATTMMTDEERAEVEKQMNAGNSNGASHLTSTPHVDTEANPKATGSDEKPPTDGAESPTHEHSPGGKKRPKITPEQKKKLEEMEAQRKKVMEERVDALTKQLIERLRPFVDAERPGVGDDAETRKFHDIMKREAEDMKLESFGVEVCLLFLIRRPVDGCLLAASSYDWISLHDESLLLPEVKEVPWHVSLAIPPNPNLA
jgi:hypothetical protein